jgi:hypothetical protein
MSKATQLLRDLNLPEGDRYDLPSSPRRFPDGAHYRIEIPSVEGPAAMAAVIEAAQQHGITLHRVSQGSGMMLLTDAELREMARLGAQHRIEVSLFVGPRATWEGTGQPLTPDGKLMGWRHTGMDQLAYAFDDIVRGVEAGIRSILVADEGLLWLVKQGRRRGVLPADLVVKGSAVLGVGNPVGVKLLEENGLDTINVASDISLPRLAAMRQVVSLPLDLYIEGPDGLGGFTRYYEVPEIIRIGAPVYLKFGLRNAPNIYPSGVHLEAAAIATGRERVRRAAIGLELLARSGAQFAASSMGAEGLGIPQV